MSHDGLTQSDRDAPEIAELLRSRRRSRLILILMLAASIAAMAAFSMR